MKLWKVILGIFTFIGGIFALGAVAKKKDEQEFDNQIKENEEQVKDVQRKVKKSEEKRQELIDKAVALKKEIDKTKAKTEDTEQVLKTIKEFETKYRKK